jgi:hypothetical protein
MIAPSVGQPKLGKNRVGSWRSPEAGDYVLSQSRMVFMEESECWF